MDYSFGLHTDVGISKSVNQDAVAVKSVETDFGKVIFAIVCDGMGGFDKGEVASASMVNAMIKWFDNDFPSLNDDFSFDDVSKQWNYIIQSMNDKIRNYGKIDGIRLGTTLSMILIFENKYILGHVGDSRIYKIESTNITQLTKDHTVVAEKFANGEITEDEIETDVDRNVLLQCIGASRKVQPQFENGTADANSVFVLCSDGFRHEISKNEIVEAFRSKAINSSDDIKMNIVRLIERAEQRKEEDNISAIVIKIL